MSKVQIFVEDNNPLVAALREIDNALELSKKVLLKNEELGQVELRSISRLEENIEEDSLISREYDKYKKTTRYKEAYPDNYVGYAYASSILSELRGLIVKFLEDKEENETQEQTFIDKGNPFTGRMVLRDILSRATKTIEIQDNYPSTEGDDQNILRIIQSNLEKIPQLKIRILAEKINSSFIADLKLFVEQYPNTLEVRKHSNSHGRFIILDDTEVHVLGSSLKDLGKKADFVTKITNQSEIDKAIKQFNIWFKEASNPLENKPVPVNPNITFEINEDKFMPWGNQATGFFQVYGFALSLKINNFKSNKNDYVTVKLKGKTTDGIWESQHFIFQQTKQELDKPDKPFEVPANKIVEIGVILSELYPEHSPRSTVKITKPDLDRDTVLLIITTESGVEQEIKIKPGLQTN